MGVIWNVESTICINLPHLLCKKTLNISKSLWVDERYRNIKLFYGIRDIFAIKRFFNSILFPHAFHIIFLYPFRILSPYPFRSAFYSQIRSVPHFIPISVPHFIPISVPHLILISVPFRRSVPHPYSHFNLTCHLVQYTLSIITSQLHCFQP